MAIKQAGSIKKPAKGSFDVKIITKTPTIIVENIQNTPMTFNLIL